jgi:Pyridoxamine 5'-phosphate oxidase
MKYNVRGKKNEAVGWEFAVDGLGTTTSDTFSEADRAIRAFIAEKTGVSAADVEYESNPPTDYKYTIDQLLDYAETQDHGGLVTIGMNGNPTISTVSFRVTPERKIRIFATENRAKIRHLRRDPRAGIYTSHELWSYVSIYGDATLSAVAQHPDDEIAHAFVAHTFSLQDGGTPDQELAIREQAVRDGRLYLEITPTRGHGLLA